jgi:ribonuclease D
VELRIKSTGIPNHRNWPQKFPEANARLVAAKAVIAELSTSMTLPPENILSPDIMRAICFEPPTELSPSSVSEFLRTKQARNWQIAAVAQRFVDALATTTVVESSAE